MKRFLLTLTAIVLLRVFLIPSLWLAAGMVAMFWVRGFLQTRFPAHKKAVTAALVTALVLVAMPYVYQLFAPYNVLSHDAGKRRLWFWDLWRAEKMDPAMLKSRNELSDQLQWLEDRVGKEHEAKLAEIRADYTSGRITAEEAWHRTQGVQEESKKFQAKTDKVSRLITSGDTSEPSADYPLCPGAAGISYQMDSLRTSIRVPLNMDCWSGTVTLPRDFHRHWKWEFNSPGDLDFFFFNGERIFIPGNTGKYGWRPPSLKFRLRGEGPYATIKIERR